MAIKSIVYLKNKTIFIFKKRRKEEQITIWESDLTKNDFVPLIQVVDNKYLIQYNIWLSKDLSGLDTSKDYPNQLQQHK
jgi:hypothetical protein